MSANRHHDHGHHVDFDSPAMVAHAESEGEVFIPLIEAAVGALADACTRLGVAVRSVVDLGCGPGVGTRVLAERFADADLVAADGSDAMLARTRARATTVGFAQRVKTRRLELPDDIEQLERADVIWASLVLHHVGDEVAALRRIRPLLEPTGLLALVELDEPLRVVAGDVNLGRPGIWARLDAAWQAWFHEMRESLPGSTNSADYPTMLDSAGYDIVVDEVLTLDLAEPLDARAARFARDHLVRTQTQLAGHVDGADLDALDRLVHDHGNGSASAHTGLSLHGSRHLYVAQPRTSASGS